MSQFSALLKEYTERSGVTIKTLSEMCGIERTYLHKILKGERKAPSVEFVSEISRQLMLSAEDRSELIKQYEIAEMGEAVYSRRKQVAEIIHSMAAASAEAEKTIPFKTKIELENVPETSVYTDSKELFRNIQVLLSYDVQNGSDIRIIAQPSGYLSRLLNYCFESKDSNIYHLFCVDNSGNRGSAYDNKYNLDIFPCMCELAMEHEKYYPFFYYDNAEAHINSTSLMPQVIITDNFVICTDDKYEEGAIYRSPVMVQFYLRQFEKLRKKCMKLLEHAVDIMEYVYFWYDEAANFISMDFQPCTMMCLTEEIFDAHATLPPDMRDLIKEKLELGRKSLLSSSFTNLFSEKGLAEFMETGEIFELPSVLYTRPTLAERKIMLQNMIVLCENGICDYRIIKNDYFASSRNLCINVAENSSLNIVARNDSFKDFSYMKVNETSVIQAFWDYYNYLLTTDNVCTPEETIEIMRSYL